MIGGYFYQHVDEDVERRVLKRVDKNFRKATIGENGFLFHDYCFGQTDAFFQSGKLSILSQELLLTCGPEFEYRPIDIITDFIPRFQREGIDALNAISTNFRMVIVDTRPNTSKIYLISNRAGSGRIYYCPMASGVIFASDIRFLFSILPLDVNEKAIYAILKYGAIPEPLTICENITAVEPSHYLEYDWQCNDFSTKPYFKIPFKYKKSGSGTITPDMFEPAKTALTKSAEYMHSLNPTVLLSGGIDSSLYACYLDKIGKQKFQGVNCTFGEVDPELPFARQIAEKVGADFHVATMGDDALNIIDDVVTLTDHPFADFSSIPVAFILKFIKETLPDTNMLIECNGADDCFGFPALGEEMKFRIKDRIPGFLKTAIAGIFTHTGYWKWLSHEGFFARLAALADAQEIDYLNYFLVQSPFQYLNLSYSKTWDLEITKLMEKTYRNCAEDYDELGFEAKTTVRQLMHINSRQWAAKALSVGESLGIRCVYPYIWREILVEQGKIPWEAKIRDGITKWPLKKLLEEFMPHDFIYRSKSGFVPPFVKWISQKDLNDKARETLLSPLASTKGIVPSKTIESLLNDALKGRQLRFPVLNFLWGALFTELWVQRYRQFTI